MAKTRNASVCATIPEALITEAIERAMIEALDKDKRMELVNAVVKAALTEKGKDSYRNDDTIFSKRVKEMIRDRAAETFEKWMKEKGRTIAAAIRKALDTRESTIIDEMVGALADESSKLLQVSVSLNLDRRE